MAWRRKFYIVPEIQFPLIVGLVLLTTLQGLFLGWGFYKLIFIAKQWERADQAAAFFLTVFGTIVPTVALNFAFGTYFSHKIAGPIYKMRKAIGEITRGNLEQELQIRKGDLLQSCSEDFERMLQTLRRLLYRDHAHSMEVNDLLTEMQAWVAEKKDLKDEERRKLQKLILDCKSRVGIINTHFLKGKQDKP